jgi:trk system potassium uptake protein TrkH
MTFDLRPVVHITGLMVLALGVLMLLPAAVDMFLGDPNGIDIATAAGISILFGLGLALSSGGLRGRGLDTRQAFVLTLAVWIALSVFGALPFVWGAPGLGWLDALFESVSGITTTGASVIVGLDTLPVGMNLWRGLLNWTGGLGIAFVAMIFLPVMRIGGMQFFRTEGFDTLGKVLPRAADIATALVRIYIGLTVACVLTYLAIGMTPLDATVNGMATIATGGFSSSDLSFVKYAGVGEYAGAFFILIASMPYIRFVQMLSGQTGALWRDSQARAMILYVFIGIAMVTAWRVATSETGLESAFRQSLFNLSSIMTTTGFFSGDFGGWGGLSVAVAVLLGLIGGCSGSSSAALTVFRVQVIFAAVATAVRRIANPARVLRVRHDSRPVDPDALSGVVFYANSFLVLMGMFAVGHTLAGVDTQSAFFAAWSSLGNIGYGYGPLVARTGTFIDFPDLSKLLMILAMLMGRLGLLAVLVVFLPRFWRD